MRIGCPNKIASLVQYPGPSLHLVVRKGVFFRRGDSRKITRYYCKSCQISFSSSTLSPKYRQRERRITPILYELICSGVSQRRMAKHLGVTRKTVVKRLRFLAEVAKHKHSKFLSTIPAESIQSIQFDDLETIEHSKCKPLSVALAVEPKTRKILGFQVSQMPAKGHLAKVSIRKYGRRKDLRHEGWNKLLSSLKPLVHPNACFTSDENPHYPKHLFKHHPKCQHVQVPGGRGSITGQGELKKKRFDPIFSLNHTCAMLRANLNRLFRRTWCTTKTRQGLIDHLYLYVQYHNEALTKELSPLKGAS